MGRVSAEEQHEVAQEAEQHDPNHVQLEEVVEAEEPACHGACMLQVGWQPFRGEGERTREKGRKTERKREGKKEQEREGWWIGREGRKTWAEGKAWVKA